MTTDLFNPTPEHAALRRLVREFTEREVDPQATASDRGETFNVALFRRLGPLGLLGITVPTEYGGSGMDAVGRSSWTSGSLISWPRAWISRS